MDITALLIKLTVAAASFGAVLLIGTPFLQRAMLYHPDRERASPADLGLAGVEERIIEMAGGARIVTWWAAAQTGFPTLVYFHGNGGSLANRAERIRKYMLRGYGMVMMTYRGFGGSTGVPSERANVADAKAVFAAVIASGVPKGSIVIYGESLGSGVAVQLAAGEQVAGVILDAPYTAMVDLAALHHPYLPARWLMTDRYETKKHIGKVTSPLLVVHGEADDIIPVEMGRTIGRSSGGPAQVATFPGAGHSDHHMFGSYDTIYAWLDKLRDGTATAKTGASQAN